MNHKNTLTWLVLAGSALALAACSPSHGSPAAASTAASTAASAAVEAPPQAAPATPAHSPVPPADIGLIVVHKNASCGCCVHWIEHMREAGFAVEVHDHADMGPVKQRVGVPYAKGSCHTAEIDGYFIEGHVPAEDVKRLLAERPDARGLTVPGMPVGSPGMEVPDGTVQPYAVELVTRDGGTRVFARHGH